MATKTKTTKKSTTKKVAQKKEKKAPEKRDKWNYRVSTKCAQINKEFSKKRATTARKISEKLGLNLNLCRNHIQTLLGKDLLKRVDDGVVVK